MTAANGWTFMVTRHALCMAVSTPFVCLIKRCWTRHLSSWTQDISINAHSYAPRRKTCLMSVGSFVIRMEIACGKAKAHGPSHAIGPSTS